jgi:hypothetical protein
MVAARQLATSHVRTVRAGRSTRNWNTPLHEQHRLGSLVRRVWIMPTGPLAHHGQARRQELEWAVGAS